MANVRLVACRAERDYTLYLRFDDGMAGAVCCRTLLDIDAFKLWRDVGRFLNPRIEPGGRAIAWDSGVRLDPEVLHQDLVARGIRPQPPRAHDPAFARFLSRAMGERR